MCDLKSLRSHICIFLGIQQRDSFNCLGFSGLPCNCRNKYSKHTNVNVIVKKFLHIKNLDQSCGGNDNDNDIVRTVVAIKSQPRVLSAGFYFKIKFKLDFTAGNFMALIAVKALWF